MLLGGWGKFQAAWRPPATMKRGKIILFWGYALIIIAT
jgi:hypothetical protein